LPPCPVDAIVGASKFLHTVLADRCTGCELCLAPCPVDCIEMRPRSAPAADQPVRNRERYEAHNERLVRRAQERQRELAALKAAAARRSAPASS
jgi:electron transport complex protein RnfB